MEALEELMGQLADDDAIVLVEGPNDAAALESWGVAPGRIRQVNERDLTQLEVVERLARFDRVVLLLDLDPKGERLTRRFQRMLVERKVHPDLRYRNLLKLVVRGKLAPVESLRRGRVARGGVRARRPKG